MKAEEFDKIFDNNKEDTIEHLDISSARRVSFEPKRVNIDFPTQMEKTWLADKLSQIEHHKAVV